MSTNKNAVLRYNTLDKCFQNIGKKFFFEDLLQEVNFALYQYNPNSSGIAIRQLREDIRFMKSTEGYDAPIEVYKEGKKAYYRYSDKNFSINKRPLNSAEAEQIKNAIEVLKRFEGSPEFEWVNEITPLLNDKFGLKNETKKVMEFDSNIDYSGHQFISKIFNAISNKIVLFIHYQPFGKEAYTVNFHPYYLKQYNNRWFVLGKNEYNQVNTWNLALDRIIKIEESNLAYIEEDINWIEYFEDMIGVSKPINEEIQSIELLFHPNQAPYIQTKPLHLSQKSKQQPNGYLWVKIEVIPNYELETKILSFGETCQVLSPKSLADKIQQRLQQATNLYLC